MSHAVVLEEVMGCVLGSQLLQPRVKNLLFKSQHHCDAHLYQNSLLFLVPAKPLPNNFTIHKSDVSADICSRCYRTCSYPSPKCRVMLHFIEYREEHTEYFLPVCTKFQIVTLHLNYIVKQWGKLHYILKDWAREHGSISVNTLNPINSCTAISFHKGASHWVRTSFTHRISNAYKRSTHH